jgi:hypothetical protein
MTDDEIEEYWRLRSQRDQEREAERAQPQQPPDDELRNAEVTAALAQPAETMNSRHRRELAMRDQEWAEARVARERLQADTMADWDARMDAKLLAVAPAIHQHVREVVDGIAGEFQKTLGLINREIEVVRTEVSSLRISNAELRASNERLRVSLQQEFMHDSCQAVAAGKSNGVGH